MTSDAKATTTWRVVDLDGWAFDDPKLTLTYDGDDYETVVIIEQAAEDARIILELLENAP